MVKGIMGPTAWSSKGKETSYRKERAMGMSVEKYHKLAKVVHEAFLWRTVRVHFLSLKSADSPA